MSAPELTGPLAKRRPAEAPRHLRLVSDDEIKHLRRRRRFRVGAAALVMVVLTLLFAAVAMHAKLAENQLKLDALTTKANDAQSRYQALQLHVDQLSSPQRVLGIARNQLGMVPPKTTTFVNPASSTAPANGITASSAAAGPPPDSGGPPPAQAPSGWSTVKPQLAASS